MTFSNFLLPKGVAKYLINFTIIILFLSYFRASHVNQAWHKMIRKEEKNARERVTIFLAKKQGYCERKGKVINVQPKFLLSDFRDMKV